MATAKKTAPGIHSNQRPTQHDGYDELVEVLSDCDDSLGAIADGLQAIARAINLYNRAACAGIMPDDVRELVRIELEGPPDSPLPKE